MLEYEPEKLPQDLKQGPKMAINLRPPSCEHWNITSDLVLPVTIDNFRQQCEARHAEQDPEGRSVGAEGSPKETPAPGKIPQVVEGSSKAALPTEATHWGGEPWRLHSAFLNTYTPFVSRHYMMLEP